LKKYYIVYCAYPYTEDPKRTADEIATWARLVYDHNKDLVLLIPHFVFDAPVGYTQQGDFKWIKGDSNDWILERELALIAKVDAVAYDPENISIGVKWEIAFARFLGKPVLTYEEIIEGKRP